MAEPTGSPVLPRLSLAGLLSRDIEIPRLVHVRRASEDPGPPLDVQRAVADELSHPLHSVQRGDSVAVAVGSRGIARVAEVVQAVVATLRQAGAVPYLVPAMGSHGGATAAGQTAVLADLGITEELAPVRASMEVVSLGRSGDVEIHVSTEALQADHVLLVNRVKSHTSFTGSVESGLAKMAAIGLGKQRGAEELHRLGPLHLERRILAAYALMASRLPVLGGLAVTEDRHKQLLALDFVTTSGIGGKQESALLDRARLHEARLPFTDLDVLVVDRMGKEISGTGMDTNVLGRRMVRGSPEPKGLSVTNVVVTEVTPGSEGNAVGLGLADFIPVAALERVDLAATYANALTAGLQGVQRAQIPIALATERDAVAAAVMTAGVADPAALRMVRIRSTLALDELMITPNLLTEGSGLATVDDQGPLPLFDDDDRLVPWAMAEPPKPETR